MAIQTLNSLIFPEDPSFKREMAAPKEFRTDAYEAAYDFFTFAYDAIYLPKKNRICLICPKLMNFRDFITQGVFTVEEQPLNILSIINRKRYSEIWLKCSQKPKHLQLTIKGNEFIINVSIQDNDAFKSLNCAVIKSKNNNLLWIRDWAEYHTKIHKLEGIIFFDNNSERYPASEIVETLSNVKGLKKICVIPTPFSFGPLALGRHRHDSKFLQLGLLNIARNPFFTVSSGSIDRRYRRTRQSFSRGDNF